MKIRSGFVSNSSSSSFVVTRLSDGKEIYSGSASYGMFDGEGDDIEDIVNGVIEGLGFNPEDFKIEMED